MTSPFCLLGPTELRRPDLPKSHRILMTPGEFQYSLAGLGPLLKFIFKAAKHTGKPPQPSESISKHKYKDLNYWEEMAWKVDPLTTLKLIFSFRKAGYLDKDGFYRSMMWVHKNHPLTLALNLMVFGNLGLFKDLLGILYKVLEESICGHYMWTRYGNWWTPNGYSFSFLFEYQCLQKENYWLGYRRTLEEKKRKAEEVAAAWTRVDAISKARIAVERYQNDTSYQNLHDQVADLFADILKADLKFLESGEIENISFAAKFCPSIHSKYDKATLICEAIAKRIFPRHDYEEYKDILEPHYAYRVRDRLRKQVLVPLRQALKPSSIQMNNAAARKMKMSPDILKAMSSLKSYRTIMSYEGNTGIKQCMKIVGMFSDGIKLPHQVITSLNKGQSSDEIAELQWQRIIQGLSNEGKLRNCVAVCDIPESMKGTNMETVCIAMGLLISEMSENPWKGKVLSSGDVPKIHNIEGGNLRSKYEFMKQHIGVGSAKKLDSGEIYDRVLKIAIKEKLGHHQIPERIFVFTDKDFDDAFKNDWFDDHTKASDDYKIRGYVFNVPDMVFWNLKGSVAKPMGIYSRVKHQDVGMIITGFSSNLLRLFLNAESDSRTYAPQFQAPYGFSSKFAPKLVPKLEDVFNCAVSGKELKNLLVFD